MLKPNHFHHNAFMDKVDDHNFEVLIERVRTMGIRKAPWEATCKQYKLLELPADAYDRAVEAYYKGVTGRNKHKKDECND